MAKYRKSMDFVHCRANKYNGGWSAAMHCARLTIPDIEWDKVEDAQSRREFGIHIDGEILYLGVIEANIANADPRFEFEEEDQDPALNETINDQVRDRRCHYSLWS